MSRVNTDSGDAADACDAADARVPRPQMTNCPRTGALDDVVGVVGVAAVGVGVGVGGSEQAHCSETSVPVQCVAWAEITCHVIYSR